jgi:hypothetical protein
MTLHSFESTSLKPHTMAIANHTLLSLYLLSSVSSLPLHQQWWWKQQHATGSNCCLGLTTITPLVLHQKSTTLGTTGVAAAAGRGMFDDILQSLIKLEVHVSKVCCSCWRGSVKGASSMSSPFPSTHCSCPPSSASVASPLKIHP